MREAQWPFVPLDKGKPLAFSYGVADKAQILQQAHLRFSRAISASDERGYPQERYPLSCYPQIGMWIG